jgi:diaminopimelate epimerase
MKIYLDGKFVDDADAMDAGAFDRWGHAVRHHQAFHPAGTNANLIHRIDEGTLRMRTWERGVEAETLACGTGSVASVLVAVQRGLVSLPVEVVVSSGRRLRVSFELDGSWARQVRLSGEARFVAEGVLSAEGLV